MVPLKRRVRRLVEALIALSTLALVAVVTRLNLKVYYHPSTSTSAASLLKVQRPAQHLSSIALPSSLPLPDLPKYTTELASIAVRTTEWICGDKNDIDPRDDVPRPFFAFVHVYKTAGSTLRSFFSSYARACRKSLMVIVSCSGATPAAGENWHPCRLKSVMDARRRIVEHDYMKDRVYPTVNATVLQRHFDILAGHYRLGATDHVFQEHRHADSDGGSHFLRTPARHIVFLRQPRERFVSSILYRAKQFSMNKKDTVEETARFIKKRVHDSRQENDYQTSVFKYLLTPEQAQIKENKTFRSTVQLVEHQTRLAIWNLIQYNAIVGMTEHFAESMVVLKHVLLPDEYTSDERKEKSRVLFEEYTTNSNKTSIRLADNIPATRKNPSQMGTISTSSVMVELEKDKIFMREFEEFLKYEQIVVDFGLTMFWLQHDAVTEDRKSVV